MNKLYRKEEEEETQDAEEENKLRKRNSSLPQYEMKYDQRERNIAVANPGSDFHIFPRHLSI